MHEQRGSIYNKWHDHWEFTKGRPLWLTRFQQCQHNYARRRAKWKFLLVESILNLLTEMYYPQIIISRCFYNLSHSKLSIPDEPLNDLSQLKFDGEGDTSIFEHASIFLKLCEYYKIDCENVACIIFYLTLEGWVNWWCNTQPPTSIHSLEHFIKELHYHLIGIITEMFIKGLIK